MTRRSKPCIICGQADCIAPACRVEKRKRRNEAGTPLDLFGVLHAEYRFHVDAAAVAHNAKLPAYLTPEDDSLSMHWGGLRVWCNSPFDNIPLWLAHSLEPDFVAYMLPARTDREWWKQYKPLAECHYFVGRVPFVAPPGVKYSTSNPDCNVLFLFGESVTPGLEVYRSAKTGERL